MKSKYFQEVVFAFAVIAFWGLSHMLFPPVGKWIIGQIYNRALPDESINHIISTALLSLSEVLLFLVFVRYHSSMLLKSDETVVSYLSPAILTALVLLAWSNRFIQDDAFISFRYAANFVHGYGLTWNPGEEAVEGYSNFLWTLLMGIPNSMKWDIVFFSYVSGLACFICTLIVTYRTALLVLRSSSSAILAVILLGTNYTFSAYATGGLETQLQAALLVSAAYLMIQTQLSGQWAPTRLMAISLISAAAVLTRLDSLLPLAVLYAFFFGSLIRHKAMPGTKIKYALLLLVPATLIGASYALWKIYYYGSILPNTYYVKVTGMTSYSRGVKYVMYFLLRYGWAPFILLFFVRIRRIVKTASWIIPLFAVVALWLGYVIKIGGDFMEFRFFVTILPFLTILTVSALSATFSRGIMIAVALCLVAVSFVHAHTFQGINSIENIETLHNRVTGRWDKTGQVLGKIFGQQRPEVVIATTAAGAIPFYSELKTVDMLGLNDKWIARYGHILGARPGHQKSSTAEYLSNRGVNLIIGHPHYYDLPSPPQSYSIQKIGCWTGMAGLNEEILPESAKVLEIPLNNATAIHAIYFIPNPSVDRIIKELGLKTFDIDRETKLTDKEACSCP
ncbi:MAG: hypothetical protein HY809_02395 [Nitrospirae bacterium]|nr:hypothetical protein [Nitrospirota bacterium]